MRKTTILAVFVAAVVASLAATIPGALAGGGNERATAAGWASTIPSKRAVSGVWGGGCVAVAAGDRCSATVTIFPSAPVDIEGQDMGILAGLVENPNCNGDVTAPSAPPGSLCGYVDETGVVNLAKNGEGAYSVQFFPIDNGRRGFLVTWSATAAGYSQVSGLWTYRAP